MYCELNMGHGKNKSYSRKKERVRQYAQIMRGKYNSPTILRLKEKVTQGSGLIALETSLDLISLYEKCYNVCDKN